MESTQVSISVIDPQNRTGKIQIPLTHIFDTKGKSEALRNHSQKDLSLCLLFQNGRCNAGSKCHQIHADCVFVQTLRRAATTASTCCALHGDLQSKELQNNDRTVLLTSQQCSMHIPTPLHTFAFTQGLAFAMGCSNRTTITVSLQRVCRLHQQNRCKYGRDCRHVHLCRDVYAKAISGAPMEAARPSTLPKMAEKAVSPAPMRVAVAPLPLCADIIFSDDAVSSNSSRHSSDTNSVATGPLSTPTEPMTTTMLLDAYLKSWTPASTCAGSCRDASPMLSDLTSLDLRLLCTEILGA